MEFSNVHILAIEELHDSNSKFKLITPESVTGTHFGCCY